MIQKGTAVIITFGPFTGCTGTIVSRIRKRVVMRVVLNPGFSFLLELDEAMVERYHQADRAASE